MREERRDERRDDLGGWRTVNRRRKQADVSGMSEKVFSFFFTKFPESWRERDLWHMFNRYGQVVDLFVARKRNYWGQKFGFVRFSGEEKVAELQRRLSAIFIGRDRLVINLEKYKRKQEVTSSHKYGGAERCDNIYRFRIPSGNERLINADGRSYREVVSGVKETVNTRPIKTVERPSEVKEKTCVSLPTNAVMTERLSRSWVGEARGIEELRSIWKVLAEIGLKDCMIQYVGGLTVLVEWRSPEVAKKILNEKRATLDRWLKKVDMWSEGWGELGRLVWLDIEGVPLHARCKEAYVKIAMQIGKVLDADDVSCDAALSYCSGVMILYHDARFINTSIDIEVDGKKYIVKVTEELNRSFLIYGPDSNYEDDIANSEDDVEDFISPLRKEEFGSDSDECVKDTMEGFISSPENFSGSFPEWFGDFGNENDLEIDGSSMMMGAQVTKAHADNQNNVSEGRGKHDVVGNSGKGQAGIDAINGPGAGQMDYDTTNGPGDKAGPNNGSSDGGQSYKMRKMDGPGSNNEEGGLAKTILDHGPNVIRGEKDLRAGGPTSSDVNQIKSHGESNVNKRNDKRNGTGLQFFENVSPECSSSGDDFHKELGFSEILKGRGESLELETSST